MMMSRIGKPKTSPVALIAIEIPPSTFVSAMRAGLRTLRQAIVHKSRTFTLKILPAKVNLIKPLKNSRKKC